MSPRVKAGAVAAVVLVAIAAVVLASRVVFGQGGVGASQVPDQPPMRLAGSRLNVVVIETDDQTAGSMKVMPMTRRLIGEQGVTFDNSFVNTSLCCPSRATFLTGQYSHNSGVKSNKRGFEKLNHRSTLAVWLQRAGYRTVMVGKYLNGYEFHPRVVPPGWTEWNAFADDGYYNYAINRNGALRRYGDDPRSYSTDVITETAVSAIRRAGGSGRPFFMWFTPYAPHTVGGGSDEESSEGKAVPAPADRGRHLDARLPRPPAFNESDVSDKPPYVKATARLSARGIRGLTDQYRSALASLAAVDRAVGSIITALEETGQLRRTLVIYTSDNGYLYGEHRQVGKVRPYEGSIRVPLVIRGPGLPAGVHRSDLVVNADLVPTIAGAAGIRPGREPDGVRLFPPAAEPGDRILLLERLRGDDELRFSGIRTARWLYAEYDETGARELYDLRADPNQLNNLAADPEHREVRDGLSAELAELRDCTGRECVRFLPR